MIEEFFDFEYSPLNKKAGAGAGAALAAGAAAPSGDRCDRDLGWPRPAAAISPLGISFIFLFIQNPRGY